MDRSTEVELKLEFAPSDRDRLMASPLLARGGTRKRLKATYFDTPALDLRHAGFTLRIRHDGSERLQTVKTADGASLLCRGEWEQPVEDDQPVLDVRAGPLRDRISEARLRRLAPLFTTDVERIGTRLDLSGATMIECTIDSGLVSADRKSARISEIELELIEGSPQSLFDLARRLDAHAPLRLGVQSKSARGYALTDRNRGGAVKAAPVALTPKMTAAQAFAAIAANCVAQYRLNEALLLDGGGPEAVHQARVAIRRLRSAFSLFSPLFSNDGQAAHIKAELRWLGAEFGAIRDLDVLLTRLRPHERAVLSAGRADRFAHLHALIESGRVRFLPVDIVEWLEIGRWRMAAVDNALRDAPVRQLAGKRLDGMRRRIKCDGHDLAELSDEHRHQLRKEAKKIRYASESLAALYPSRKARTRMNGFLGSLERLQDALGQLNDDASTAALLALYSSDIEVPLLGEKRRRGLMEKAESAINDLIGCRRFWRA